MAINSLSSMRDYCKRMCGHPVINVEIADDQLNQIIEDTVQDFNRLNYGEASYLDYVLFTTSANVAEYNLSGNEINDVWDLSVFDTSNGINTMFSPTHILLYQQWVDQGGYPGAGGYGGAGGGFRTTDSGLTLAQYEISMQYLEDIQRRFGKEYQVNYLPNRQVLRIYPTPTTAITGVLAVYKKETAQYLYNHSFVKKLAVARTKKLWGLHLSKYGATLPDGLTINGDSIWQEGVQEEEKWYEEMRLNSEPIDFWIE